MKISSLSHCAEKNLIQERKPSYFSSYSLLRVLQKTEHIWMNNVKSIVISLCLQNIVFDKPNTRAKTFLLLHHHAFSRVCQNTEHVWMNNVKSMVISLSWQNIVFVNPNIRAPALDFSIQFSHQPHSRNSIN